MPILISTAAKMYDTLFYNSSKRDSQKCTYKAKYN